jgi:hypothetical protein
MAVRFSNRQRLGGAPYVSKSHDTRLQNFSSDIGFVNFTIIAFYLK